MKINAEFIVYIVGICPFGFYYDSIKATFGGGFWFIVAAVIYLLALRGLGLLVRRWLISPIDTLE